MKKWVSTLTKALKLSLFGQTEADAILALCMDYVDDKWDKDI